MKRTSAQVKNVMWRGLQCLVDPEPNKTQRNAAFAYFNYKCAYCPETITLEIGDLDHLVPVSQHGHGWNHISNLPRARAATRNTSGRNTGWCI